MGLLQQRRFRKAVDEHYRLVYQTAAGLLRDPAEAEDVTQETFTQYWQHGDGTRHTKAWLLRVARNRCLDRLRRRARLEYREPSMLPEAPDLRDSLVDLELSEMTQKVRRAVEALPEPQRSIVVLFSLQGMSGRDCAEVLGLTVNQVKVYLHRARNRLKGQFDEHELQTMEMSHGR